MRHAGTVFLAAAAFGLAILPPLYFLEDFLVRQVPPPITHPEFYYGMLGPTLAWQIVYLMIGLDPARYRPLMPVAALAKGLFVASMVILVLLNRVPLLPALLVAPDLVFTLLFLSCWRHGAAARMS